MEVDVAAGKPYYPGPCPGGPRRGALPGEAPRGCGAPLGAPSPGRPPPYGLRPRSTLINLLNSWASQVNENKNIVYGHLCYVCHKTKFLVTTAVLGVENRCNY